MKKENYLDVIYFREEYGENKYPQKLCDHIIEQYFSRNGSVAGKKLLDIGSGKGNHLIGFQRRGLKVYGIDKRDECIEVLKDIDIRPCDLEKDPLPFEDNQFDFIFTKSVLEHVYNAENFISQTLRVLKPGGMAVMMTPDWRSQCLFFWDDYTHVKAFTKKSLANAMRINGFADARCDYFLQLPFIWKHPGLQILTSLIACLPDCLKWKDNEQSQHRPLIRFSKEKMLIATGKKPA